MPYTDFGSKHHISTIALVVRIGVSAIYAIDMTVPATSAKRHLFYLLTHPVGVLSVPLPPIRLIFSLRLLRSIFRRGNLWRFLVAASVLVLNGATLVYLFERHAPGSNSTRSVNRCGGRWRRSPPSGTATTSRLPSKGGSQLSLSWRLAS